MENMHSKGLIRACSQVKVLNFVKIIPAGILAKSHLAPGRNPAQCVIQLFKCRSVMAPV